VLIVTFRYTPMPGSDPVLFYFDAAAGAYVPVQGSRLVPLSLVINTADNTITVVFDATSVPTLAQLGGTVFCVPLVPASSDGGTSSPPTTAVTTTVTPALALALPQDRGAAAFAEQQRTVTFQTASELTTSVASAQDTAGLTSNVGGSDEEAEEGGDTGEELPRFLEKALEELFRLLRRRGLSGVMSLRLPEGVLPAEPPPASAAPAAAGPDGGGAAFDAGALDALFAGAGDVEWPAPAPIPAEVAVAPVPADAPVPPALAAAALLLGAGRPAAHGRRRRAGGPPDR
jgi:hypothetical protein